MVFIVYAPDLKTQQAQVQISTENNIWKTNLLSKQIVYFYKQ